MNFIYEKYGNVVIDKMTYFNLDQIAHIKMTSFSSRWDLKRKITNNLR